MWVVLCGTRGLGGAGHGRGPGVTGEGACIGIGAGGARATRSIQCTLSPSPGWGSGPLARGVRQQLPGGAALSGLRRWR